MSLTKEYLDIKKISLSYPVIDGLICRIYNKIEQFEMIELRVLPEEKAQKSIAEVKEFVSEKISELENKMKSVKKWDSKELDRISEWIEDIQKFIKNLDKMTRGD